MQSLSGPRKASYALVVLALLVAARFNLGSALIAALFAYMILTKTEEALLRSGASAGLSRWASVGLFVVLGALLSVIFVSFIKIGLSRLPLLLDRVLPRLDEFAERSGLDLPLGNVSELRELILRTVKENARSITSASGLMTRGFFQIVSAVVVAILRFVSPRAARADNPGLDERFLHECAERVALFAASFDRVMGAQVMIAAINAGVAAVFLFIFHFPFRTMLTLTTFVCGLVPIVGNVISNSLIVAAALTRSDNLAIASLIFLVVVHKAGYFLNSRIVGARTATPTWAILLGLLVGEALMGVTGVILAPTVIYYVREELRMIPA